VPTLTHPENKCAASCAGTGEEVCNALCVNTLTDNANCGDCGNVCDPRATCTSGVCTCPTIQVDCDGSNRANDPDN
jgi:hypothetical protein